MAHYRRTFAVRTRSGEGPASTHAGRSLRSTATAGEAVAGLASNSGPLGGENKVVEADKEYIGGKARNNAG